MNLNRRITNPYNNKLQDQLAYETAQRICFSTNNMVVRRIMKNAMAHLLRKEKGVQPCRSK